MRRGAFCIQFPKGSEAVGRWSTFDPHSRPEALRGHCGSRPPPRPDTPPAPESAPWTTLAPAQPQRPRRRSGVQQVGRPDPAQPALHGALTVWILGAALRTALWPPLPPTPASFIRRPARPAGERRPAHLLGQWARAVGGAGPWARL